MYLFNDDKSKSIIKIIEGVIESVSPNANNGATYTPTRLREDYGIDNLDDYVPISVVQDNGDREVSYIWTTPSIEGSFNEVYPSVNQTLGGKWLSVNVFNKASNTRTIRFRVVLLKIK